MAKELSMVEDNDKGKQSRRYFIEAEKLFKKYSEFTTSTSKSELAEWEIELENLAIVFDAINEPLFDDNIQGRKRGFLE